MPCSSRAADDNAAMLRIIDNAVRPVIAEYDLPGMAVAVTIKGRAYFYNYGVASRETGQPVSEHTLFELGSVSKTFTATLGAYAQVLGKLALDDHPSRYLPQLQGRAIDRASLLHLATYTAGGLPLQVPDSVPDRAAIPAYFQHWQPDAAPGQQRRYSNPSIGLFGQLTALALQRDFTEAMQHDLLPQLGLRHTYLGVPASAMPDYAWGYDKANKPGRVSPDVYDAESYGMKSSSADMIRFVQLNLDGSALPDPVRRAVEATHVGHFDMGNMVQGLGWEQYPYPVTLARLLDGNSASMASDPHPARLLQPARIPAGPTLYNKTGSTSRFGAYVLFVPQQQIGIVLLANRNYPIPA
ncbi:MAG: class C beta-lactamase, partial [Sphingomonadaceae bacterium]